MTPKHPVNLPGTGWSGSGNMACQNLRYACRSSFRGEGGRRWTSLRAENVRYTISPLPDNFGAPNFLNVFLVHCLMYVPKNWSDSKIRVGRPFLWIFQCILYWKSEEPIFMNRPLLLVDHSENRGVVEKKNGKIILGVF